MAVNLFNMGSSCSVPCVNARPSTGLSGCGERGVGGGGAKTGVAFGDIAVGGVAGGGGPKSSSASGAGVSRLANMASQSCDVLAGGGADCAEAVGFVSATGGSGSKLKFLLGAGLLA